VIGDGGSTPLWLKFNPKIRLDFYRITITSDAGSLPPENWMMPSALPIYSHSAGYDDTNYADHLS
jgi:hypothetical protein